MAQRLGNPVGRTPTARHANAAQGLVRFPFRRHTNMLVSRQAKSNGFSPRTKRINHGYRQAGPQDATRSEAQCRRQRYRRRRQYRPRRHRPRCRCEAARAART